MRRLRLWTLNIIIWLLLNYLSCLVTFTRNCGFLSFILTSSVSIFISDIPFAWFGRWDTWNPKIITELTFQGSRAQQPRSQLNKIYLEQENITWWDKMIPIPLANTLKYVCCMFQFGYWWLYFSFVCQSCGLIHFLQVQDDTETSPSRNIWYFSFSWVKLL